MAETILVGRLYEFVDPDPWAVGFRMWMVDHAKKNKKHYGWFDDWEARQHAERIRYLASAPELSDPINVDNYCENNHITPIPIIEDGHHRLFAHVWLGRKTIEALYGGRLDVLDYLKGETDSLPGD